MRASADRVLGRVQQFTAGVRGGVAGNARRAHARALAGAARRAEPAAARPCHAFDGRVSSRCDPRRSARVTRPAPAAAVSVRNLTPLPRLRAPAVGAWRPLARPVVGRWAQAASRCGICPPRLETCPYCSVIYADNLARWVGLHLADGYPLRANGEAPPRRTKERWGRKPNGQRRRPRPRRRRRRARVPPRGARRPRASPLCHRVRAPPRRTLSPPPLPDRSPPPRSRGARYSRSSSRGSSCPRTSIR